MTRNLRTALTILAAIVVPSAFAGAQSAPRLDRLEVAIWPEYDQPAALVMLRGFLPLDAPLPTVVPLAMPAEVTEPNAVAKRSPDGQGLLLAAYTVEARDRWKIFWIETDTREVRLEFYVPMDLSQPQREIIFEWPGGIDIGQIMYEIQQPVGATDMVLVPPGQRRPGPDGLTYAFADLGPLSAAEAATIAITYTKSSPGLSIASLQPTLPPPVQQATPPAPAEEAATQPADSGSSHWAVTIAIVVAAGLLLLWFFVSGKKD